MEGSGSAVFWPHRLQRDLRYQTGSITCVWGERMTETFTTPKFFNVEKKHEELATTFKTFVLLAAKILIAKKSNLSPKVNKRKAAHLRSFPGLASKNMGPPVKFEFQKNK